jgi:hypothetical protein
LGLGFRKLLQWALATFPALQGLYNRLQKTKKTVLFPKDQKNSLNLMVRCGELYKEFQNIPAGTLEELEKTIPDIHKLKKIIDELNKDYFPFHLDGKIGIVPRGATDVDIYRNFGESLQESAGWSMLSLEQADQSINFKETPIIMSEQLAGVTEKLDDDLKTLVNTSSHIEELYKSGKSGSIASAEVWKKGVKDRFLDFGARFCNLYQRYLIKLMISLADKPPAIINADIREFVNREANHIFFIFMRMNPEEVSTISERLHDALESRSKYVAIHSLGAAAGIAKWIVDSVELKMEEIGTKLVGADPEGYLKPHVIDTGQEFSKIWYTKEGEKILSYFSQMGT